MNFIKKVFGFQNDFFSELKAAKFEGTLYRVIKDTRNIIFKRSIISFVTEKNQKQEDIFLICFHSAKEDNTKEEYAFPFHLNMNLLSFTMTKQGKQNSCFEWNLNESQTQQDHIGCYINPQKKQQFKDLFCKILKNLSNDQNIKDHLYFCKQLNGIPTYISNQEFKINQSKLVESKLKQNKITHQLNDLLIIQAGKNQNKFVHSASCFEIIQKKKIALFDPIIIVIKSTDKFQYQIHLINQSGNTFLTKQLNSGLHYTINIQDLYFKWLDINQLTSRVIEVDFKQVDSILSLKFAIMQCLYQINTQRKVIDTIAEEQYQYMKKITEKPQQSQKFKEQIIKTYDDNNNQQIEIKQNQFIYDNEQVHKGLEKYRNLCQAKIIDFEVASLGSMLQMLKISSQNQIKRTNQIKLKAKNNNQLIIDQILMHDNDSKSLLHGQDGLLYYCDLNKGEIIQQYNPSQKGIQYVCPEFKLAETSNFKTFKAISLNTIYEIDPRLNDGISKHQSYSTNPLFTRIGVDVKGNFAVGTQNGEIKLYNQIGKKATTRYPGLGDPVLHLDSTKDGKLLLATFKNYLLLLPTQTEEGQNLYSTKTKISSRPYPIKLQIKIQHLQLCKIKLRNLTMIPAKFDQRTDSKERFIISGFGQYVVVWNLAHILKGNIRQYKFTRVGGEVIQADFKFNNVSKLIMTTSNGISVKQNKLQK